MSTNYTPETINTKVFQQITKLIIKGNLKHFHQMLDEYGLVCTNPELETLRLLYHAGYENGIRHGAAAALEECSKVMSKLFVESH